MKRLFWFVVVLVLCFGAVTFGEAEESVAEYPGELVCDPEWTQEIAGGFEVGYTMTLWEPVKATENFAHPDGRGFMVEAYEVEGRDTWVIPFRLVISNETVGFGSIETDTIIGVTLNMIGHGGIRKGFNAGLWQMSYGSRSMVFNESGRRSLDAVPYIATEFAGSDGSTKMYDVIRMTAEIDEGGQGVVVRGYYLFADARKTPNMREGAGEDWFESKNVNILVGDCVTRMYHCRRVAKLSMVDGELMLSEVR